MSRDAEVVALARMSDQEQEKGLDFVFARFRLQSTLTMIERDGGLREAPEFRPRVFGYRVSGRAMRRRQGWYELGRSTRGVSYALDVLADRPLPRPIPWGWTAIAHVDTNGRHDVWYVGPWWLMWPRALRRWWWIDAMPVILDLALAHGLARVPDEGCYYHEVEWFPDAPRFK